MHQSWSMDFVSDQLFDGRKFWAFTLVDNFGRKCLAIYAEQSIKGSDVVSVMNQVVLGHGHIPERLQVDNGSEFISKALDLWTSENKVTLDFSRPGNRQIIPILNLSTEAFAMSV